jgi:hypothetical protein
MDSYQVDGVASWHAAGTIVGVQLALHINCIILVEVDTDSKGIVYKMQGKNHDHPSWNTNDRSMLFAPLSSLWS